MFGVFISLSQEEMSFSDTCKSLHISASANRSSQSDVQNTEVKALFKESIAALVLFGVCSPLIAQHGYRHDDRRDYRHAHYVGVETRRPHAA